MAAIGVARSQEKLPHCASLHCSFTPMSLSKVHISLLWWQKVRTNPHQHYLVKLQPNMLLEKHIKLCQIHHDQEGYIICLQYVRVVNLPAANPKESTSRSQLLKCASYSTFVTTRVSLDTVPAEIGGTKHIGRLQQLWRQICGVRFCTLTVTRSWALCTQTRPKVA